MSQDEVDMLAELETVRDQLQLGLTMLQRDIAESAGEEPEHGLYKEAMDHALDALNTLNQAIERTRSKQ